MNQLIQIATFQKPYKLNGWIKIRFQPGVKINRLVGVVLFAEVASSYQPLFIEEIKQINKDWAVKLKNVNHINDVEQFVNHKLYARQQDYILNDSTQMSIVDYQVYFNGLLLGCVTEMMSNGVQQIIRIQQEDKTQRDMLIPVVDAFIESIEHQTQTVVLRQII